MPTDPVEQLLSGIDRPLTPRPEFAEALLDRLLFELEPKTISGYGPAAPTQKDAISAATTALPIPEAPPAADPMVRFTSQRTAHRWRERIPTHLASAALLVLTLAAGYLAVNSSRNSAGDAPPIRLAATTMVPGHDELTPRAFLDPGTGLESFDITIPDGWRMEQIAEEYERLGGKGGAQAFLDAARNIDRSQFDFLIDLPPDASLEGYLFPGTYRFDAADPGLNVAAMLTNFDTHYTSEMRERTRTMGRTIHDVVTVASLVEREAPLLEERPTIADVYLSRWEQGWRLDADATVQYALGTPEEWWPVLSGADLFVDSRYNTYQHEGLPAGPIANPGLASIQAVLFPDNTPYLFFTVKDATGAHAFAVTVEEQLANIERYLGSETAPGTPVPIDQGPGFEVEGLRDQLGSGWVVADARTLMADAEAPAITGFLGSSTIRYRGPAGSRISVIVFPLAADPAAAAMAWDWIGETEFDSRADDALRHEPNAEQAAARAPLPVGCRDARRLEGTDRLDWDLTIGMTLCAVGMEEIVLSLTSGKVLDQEGVDASDRVAELVAADMLAARIVATHRIHPEITSAVNLRAAPSRSAAIVTEVGPGAALRWLGDAARATDPKDGTVWLEVRTADGQEGWVRGIDLIPLSP